MQARRAGPPRPSQMDEQAATPDDEGTPEERPRVAASESVEPIEPAIGQWVRYGIRWRNGGRSTTRYAIVDREAGGFWVEVEDRRRGQVRHVRMHVRPGEETELLALAFKRNGEVQEIPSRLLPSYRPMLEQWFALLFPQTIEGEPETVDVPAGVFEEAHQSTASIQFGEQQGDARLWRHTAVPVTGLVKLEDASGQHSMRLLGYSLEGARSTF